MKIDVMHAAYTIGMILLAFVAALVATKTISKYFIKNDDEESSK